MTRLVLLLALFGAVLGCDSKSGRVCISLHNNCPFPIWPGIQGPGTPEGGGFRLDAGQTRDIHVQNGWTAGRIWARRGCDGNFNCDSGFCGNNLAYNGAGGVPPATLAEFTLNGHGGQDFYDVSLVDGYNLPMFIEPIQETFIGNGDERPRDCKRAGGCFQDLTDPSICPRELQVVKNGKVVACKSACLHFNNDQYCCRGAHNQRDTCKSSDWPTNYPAIFKKACPTAYSYAYDDESSIFTCRGNGSTSPAYKIQFC